MKKSFLIFVFFAFSLYGFSQNFHLLPGDSLQVFKSRMNQGLSPQNQLSENIYTTFSLRLNKGNFSVFSDTLHSNAILYDFKRHQYFQNAYMPFSNFGSAVLGGTLNYLIFLLSK